MSVINDWKGLWNEYNWYTFHFIHIYFENDIMTGGLDFEFVVLGLGIRLRYNYDFEGSETGKRFEEYKKSKNI